MASAALVFGSTTGCTADVAQRIATTLRPLCEDPVNIRYGKVDALLAHDALILGVPTWGIGDLQDDWQRARRRLERQDFSGKLVALFGLGDQLGFPDHFLDAMGTIYRIMRERGARVVGSWPTDGYDFDRSTAVVDGCFVGLALDENCQSSKTDERIHRWANQIRPELECHLGVAEPLRHWRSA
ncbi:MAG: flavodoxin [Deltaproteobacteria bacterium]|jgi:flavodoxin I|nr:flavodoxin [Deltaproteobacteria bacterium]MBW2534837.1 flavodoxin [Deltaproteobacteria bacterium]